MKNNCRVTLMSLRWKNVAKQFVRWNITVKSKIVINGQLHPRRHIGQIFKKSYLPHNLKSDSSDVQRRDVEGPELVPSWTPSGSDPDSRFSDHLNII